MVEAIQVSDQGRPRLRIRLTIFSSTLRLIKNNGNMLYNRINIPGYKESEEDIKTVSVIAGDIRDALLDYQVGDLMQLLRN